MSLAISGVVQPFLYELYQRSDRSQGKDSGRVSILLPTGWFSFVHNTHSVQPSHRGQPVGNRVRTSESVKPFVCSVTSLSLSLSLSRTSRKDTVFLHKQSIWVVPSLCSGFPKERIKDYVVCGIDWRVHPEVLSLSLSLVCVCPGVVLSVYE